VAEICREIPIKSIAHYRASAVPCSSEVIQRTTGLTTPAHEAVKEVAQMKLNTIPMTANIPSGFGMPICGHLPKFGATSLTVFGTTSVVRERQAAATGDMGLAYTPGTSAWRPPSS
jgi:hypothetical protein